MPISTRLQCLCFQILMQLQTSIWMVRLLSFCARTAVGHGMNLQNAERGSVQTRENGTLSGCQAIVIISTFW